MRSINQILAISLILLSTTLTAQPLGEQVLIGHTWLDYQGGGTLSKMIAVDDEGGVHFTWTNAFDAQMDRTHVTYNCITENGDLLVDPGDRVAVNCGSRATYPAIRSLPIDGRASIFYFGLDRQNGNVEETGCFLAVDWFNYIGAFQSSCLPDLEDRTTTRPHGSFDRGSNVHILSYVHSEEEDVLLADVQYVRGVPDQDYLQWEFSDPVSIGQVSSNNYTTAASRVSDKVALIYMRPLFEDGNDELWQNIGAYINNDLIVVESADGEDWDFQNSTNITQVLRPAPEADDNDPLHQGDTQRPFQYVDALYDEDDNLHIIFTTVGLWEAVDPEQEDPIDRVEPNNTLIWHWDRDSDEIHLVADGQYDAEGEIGLWRCNFSFPSLGVDENGDLYCAFTAFPEDDVDDNGYVNGEIYATVSENEGQSWATPTNLTNSHGPREEDDEFISECWSSLAEVVTDELHIIYIHDYAAGNALNEEGVVTDNSVIYHHVPVEDIDREQWVEDREFHIQPAPDDQELIVDLRQGWNIISVNVLPGDEMFADAELPGPDIELMTEQLRIDEENHHLLLMKDEMGRFYNPAFGFNNIPFWNLAEGYQVNVDEDIVAVWQGLQIPTEADVPISEGWNLIAYFPDYLLSAEAPDFMVLSPVIESVIMAKDGSGRFLVTEHNFSNMIPWRPGQGYQINVNADVVLNYPPQAENLQQGEIGGANLADAAQNGRRLSSENMSVLIKTTGQGDIHEGDKIFALNENSVVVGSGTINSDFRCGLAVWGDDESTEAVEGLCAGESFELSLLTSGNSAGASLRVSRFMQGNGLVYETNGFIALEVEPVELIPQVTYFDPCYPNPFNHVVRLSYGIPDKSVVSITAYTLDGREAAHLFDGEVSAGRHNVTWNAEGMAAGMYIVTLKAENFTSMQKVTLLK